MKITTANSVVNMRVAYADKHWRRVRRRQLVLLLFLSATRHMRLVGEYVIFHIAFFSFFYISFIRQQISFTVLHCAMQCDEQKRELKFIDQLNR